MTPDLPHVIQLVDVIIQAANEGKQQHHLDSYPVDCQHLRSLPCNLLSNVMDLFQALAELLRLFKMSVLLSSLGLDWPPPGDYPQVWSAQRDLRDEPA